MKAEVKKWGNSAVVRIPAPMLKELGLSESSPIDIKATEGRIVIEPLEGKEYSLKELLKGSTQESFKLDSEDSAWVNDEPMGIELL